MTAPVAVVTGASAGVGRATAVAFAHAGYDVALVSRESLRLYDAAIEARRAGGRVHAFLADVADPVRLDDVAIEIEETLGPIEVWVNNAMVTVFARFEDMTAEEFARVTAVTYLGAVNGTRAALKRMLPRDRGSIVQVGSALAYRSIPLQSAYCGAKAGIRGFTDSIRSELIHARSHVRVSMVQLSAFNTPQFDWARSRLPRKLQPVPPIFQPELAARAIVFAARSRRREVWVGWPAIRAILSTRVIPGLGDRLAARGAWDEQETDESARSRPDNLFEPVPGHFGAHGRFDDRARSRMVALWIVENRYLVLVVLTALVLWALLTKLL
jgi:NAD(P)-dependent dehydrogenase (short-subunit alcohol dehydrogenase family)